MQTSSQHNKWKQQQGIASSHTQTHHQTLSPQHQGLTLNWRDSLHSLEGSFRIVIALQQNLKSLWQCWHVPEVQSQKPITKNTITIAKWLPHVPHTAISHWLHYILTVSWPGPDAWLYTRVGLLWSHPPEHSLQYSKVLHGIWWNHYVANSNCASHHKRADNLINRPANSAVLPWPASGSLVRGGEVLFQSIVV